MPVGIVQVANNTDSVLHYKNEESGLSFSVNPTTPSMRDTGSLSTSTYHNPDDTVPFLSSGHKIVISLDNNHPLTQFTICDDYYKFSVACDEKKTEEVVRGFGNGDRFLIKVDGDGVQILRYDFGLGPIGLPDQGFLVTRGNGWYQNAILNPTYSMKVAA